MMPGMSTPDSPDTPEPSFRDRPDRGETHEQWTRRIREEQTEAKAERKAHRAEDRKEASGKVVSGAVKGAVKGAAVGGVGALPGAAAGAAKGFFSSRAGRRVIVGALALVLVITVGLSMVTSALIGGASTALSGGHADTTMSTVQKDMDDDETISELRAAASRSGANWLVLNSLHRIQNERTAHDGTGPFAIDEAYICEAPEDPEPTPSPSVFESASPSASPSGSTDTGASSQGGLRAANICADPDAKPVDEDGKELKVVTSEWFPQGMITKSAAMDLVASATFVGTYLADGERDYLVGLDNPGLDAGAVDINGETPTRKVADTEEAKAASQAVKDAYLKAFESMPVEGAEDFADDTVTQAQSWALGNTFAVCGTSSAGNGSITPGNINGQTSANLNDSQLRYAQTIIDVVASRNMPENAAVVALATAMQESTFRMWWNVRVPGSEALTDDKTAKGQDGYSVGLFQQQVNGNQFAWGSVKDAMDPVRSTEMFLDALERLNGWEGWPVTVAAQRVQGSAHPDKYAQWESLARTLVKDLKPNSGGYAEGHGHGDDDHADTVSLNTSSGTATTFSLASSLRQETTFAFASSTEQKASITTVNTGGLSVDSKTTPIAQKATKEIIKRYGDALDSIGGYRSDGEHGEGRAIDLMLTDYKSAGGLSNGNTISQFLIDNANQLSVEYVIFNDRIWLGKSMGWKAYSTGGYGSMYDGNWDDNTLHKNHVHVTFKNTPGTDGVLVDGGGIDDTTGGSGDCMAGGNYGTGISDAGEGDDYPFKNPAGKCSYSASCGAPDPANPADPWGGFMRECVSFTYWRINQQMGWDGKGVAPFSNQKLGVQLGNAATWKGNLVAKGYKADNKPAPGAIAWWGANSSHPMISTGPAGHVGIVKEVKGNGDIVLEQYNFIPWRYNSMVIPANQVDAFIHVADTTDTKKAKAKTSA